jgi:hypothetical protein
MDYKEIKYPNNEKSFLNLREIRDYIYDNTITNDFEIKAICNISPNVINSYYKKVITWKCGLHQSQCISLIYYALNNVSNIYSIDEKILYDRDTINLIINKYNKLLNKCTLCKILNLNNKNFHQNLIKYYQLPFTSNENKKVCPYINYNILKKLNLKINKPICVSTNKIKGKEFCILSINGIYKIPRIKHKRINKILWDLNNENITIDIIKMWEKVKAHLFKINNNIVLYINSYNDIIFFDYNNNNLEHIEKEELIFNIDINIDTFQEKNCKDINITLLNEIINENKSIKILYKKNKYLLIDKCKFYLYQNKKVLSINEFF